MVSSDRVLSAVNEDWEHRWAPYDDATYRLVLEQLHPEDVVLEIGAGDLRLARQMAVVARQVYGIEINHEVLGRGLSQPLPENLAVLQADALVIEFPSEVTTGVLLMRHCKHFTEYATKLKHLGCQKLITNARWHLAVETIALQAPRVKFVELEIGWFACWCGAAGFKSGPAEMITPETDEIIYEIIDCPKCSA
jgi:hypothetical protein